MFKKVVGVQRFKKRCTEAAGGGFPMMFEELHTDRHTYRKLAGEELVMLRMREAKAKKTMKGCKSQQARRGAGMRKAKATKSRINHPKAAKAKTPPAGEKDWECRGCEKPKPKSHQKPHEPTRSRKAKKPRFHLVPRLIFVLKRTERIAACGHVQEEASKKQRHPCLPCLSNTHVFLSRFGLMSQVLFCGFEVVPAPTFEDSGPQKSPSKKSAKIKQNNSRVGRNCS